MADLDVEQIRAVHAAATNGPYRWAGNTDYEDVRLAGAGGTEVFAIIEHDRTVDDPQSRAYAHYLSVVREKVDGEFRSLTEDDIAERVRQSIAYDEDEEQPPTYSALAFYVPGFAYEHARDRAVYQVARIRELPDDTPRSDERIYRADVVDVRNPNARFLRDSWAYVEFLLGENERVAADAGCVQRQLEAAMAGLGEVFQRFGDGEVGEVLRRTFAAIAAVEIPGDRRPEVTTDV